VAASDAEARSRHRNHAGAAVAAGIVGLAAGAILAGSASRAYAAPSYGYYAAPVQSYAYDYDDDYYARPVYRTKRVVRYVERPHHVTRVVRHYDHGYGYGSPYRGVGYGW
jgi:hypothetical protein